MPGLVENVFGAVSTIKVHIASEDDLRNFATLISQNLTVNTHSVWYPKQNVDHWKNQI